MDIRLIATDLDGTLLDEKKQISKRNMDALCRAAGKGIWIVPVTGRIFNALPEPLKALPFLRYAITVNGSGVYDRRQDKMLFQAEIPCEEAIQICRFIRQFHTMYDCYMNGKGYMEQYYYDQIDVYCREEYRPMVRKTRTPVPDLVQCLREHGDVQKLQMFFVDMELRSRVMREVALAFPDTAVTSSVVNNIEINTAAANKGNALRILCEHLGIDLSQVVAFGDGGNDVTMLKTAGIGVAMENACEEAKEAADRSTLTNEQDGVADFLEKYVL